MLTLAIVLIGSYLLGSIPFGYLVGRIARIDIRNCGSGNVGTTNVIRTLGRVTAIRVRLGFLEGFGAVKISIMIATRAQSEGTRQRCLESSRRYRVCLGIPFPCG